jgi:hypothetical protein
MQGEPNEPTTVQTKSPDEPGGGHPPSEAASHSDRSWPASAALVTAWICPAKTARRTNDIPLTQAYACHLAAMLLGLVALILVVGVQYHLSRATPTGILRAMGNVVGEIVHELTRAPREAWAILVGFVVAIELGFALLALIATPWGAKDEPLRASVSSALRRTWIQTAHLLPIILIYGLWVAKVNHAAREWWDIYYRPIPPVPKTPKDQPPESEAWQEYRKALDSYGRRDAEQRRLWARRPWYIKHAPAAHGYPLFMMLTWYLWGVFRAVGADRKTPMVDRPPMCEACGYNLTGAPMDGRCPECGHLVVHSLGSDVRPGVLWEHWRGYRLHLARRLPGREPALQRGDPRLTVLNWPRSRAWGTTARLAIVAPAQFGRHIQTRSGTTHHRSFLLLAMPLVFIIGAIGINLCYLVDTGRNPLARGAEIAWLIGPLVGYLTCIFMMATALVSAWIAALWYRVPQRRNLLPATMQVVAYLGGYLVLWGTLAALAGMAALSLEDLFRAIERVVRVDYRTLILLAWYLFNVICLLGYLLLVHRTTAATRYANK